MGYTNETTHYGIPLPLGSDLTTPMDYNESIQDVDTALFESKTDSASALQKANQLQQDLATTNDNLTGVTGRVTTLEGTVTTQGGAILQNTQDIADVRADALDMITAKDEGTAQVATVAVAKGEYFRYNDVLYIATDDIAINDTIVPNENCRATNVGTELTQINSGKGSVQVSTDGVKTFAQLFNELFALVDMDKVTDTSKLEYINVAGNSNTVYTVVAITPTAIIFSNCTTSVAEGNLITQNTVTATGSTSLSGHSTTANDVSNNVAPSGRLFRIKY